jgi:hypothetical protein
VGTAIRLLRQGVLWCCVIAHSQKGYHMHPPTAFFQDTEAGTVRRVYCMCMCVWGWGCKTAWCLPQLLGLCAHEPASGSACRQWTVEVDCARYGCFFASAWVLAVLWPAVQCPLTCTPYSYLRRSADRAGQRALIVLPSLIAQVGAVAMQPRSFNCILGKLAHLNTKKWHVLSP